MTNVTNKIFVDKMGGRSSSEYIGVGGELFYDPSVGDIRLADGRPGGRPVVSQQVGPYRGFQAGCNQFLNSYGTNVVQIILHNADAAVDYINFTEKTYSDDFYATNFKNNQAQRANKIIALNLYSAPSIDSNENKATRLSVDNIRGFVRKFIDTVLYNMQDEAITDINVAKQAFYDNIEMLANTLPNGTLFENFTFDDGGRVSWPEYNGPDGNASANFKIIQWASYGGPTYNENSEVVMQSSGTGYKVGDKIVINGQQMYGVDGANDFTLEVVSLKSGNITGLTMTSGGTNFYPHTRIGHAYSNYSSGMNTNGDGYDASIHIISCDTSGVIQDWELTSDGYDYAVGDILTVNFGGDNATFEVTSVGTDGINAFGVSGISYLGSPARIQYGYWPKYSIDNGSYNQYSWGNILSTESASATFLAHFDGHKMTIDDVVKYGAYLQAGMRATVSVPWNEDPVSFELINQASDNSGVWYINDSFNMSTLQVRFDNINYNGGNVVGESDEFNGGDYVVMFDKGVFALMSFNANINSLYYNGYTGLEPWVPGYKQIDTVMGAHGGPDSTIQIPLKQIWNSNYEIISSDAGRSILYKDGGTNYIRIPTDATTPMPLGTAITIISADAWTYINATDSNITNVFGAGFNTTSNAWYIPNNSMATIVKIAPDTWMLSGAGLAID